MFGSKQGITEQRKFDPCESGGGHFILIYATSLKLDVDCKHVSHHCIFRFHPLVASLL